MDTLSKTWRTWQAQRQAEIIAGGMPPDVAKEVSTREAIGRQRYGRVFGDSAAMRGTVIWRDQPDGTTKFYLMVDPSDIPCSRWVDAIEFLLRHGSEIEG